MKKMLYALLLLFGTAIKPVAADNFQFVYYYPPGGGTETWSNPLIQELERRGHTVSKDFFKSCHEALTYAKKQTNVTFVVAGGMDLLPTTSKRCPSLNELPDLRYISNIASGSFFVCTVPSHNNLTIKDFNRIKPLNLGTVSTDTVMVPLQSIVRHKSPEFNVKVIPYKTQGELRAAALAGTDLDLIYMASNVDVIMEAGGKCLLSSVEKNYLNLPWLGQFGPSTFQDAYQTFDLWSFSPDASIDKVLLRDVLSSKTFNDFLSARPSFSHRGLASNLSSEQQFQSYLGMLRSVNLQ